jgi:TolA-binding protein
VRLLGIAPAALIAFLLAQVSLAQVRSPARSSRGRADAGRDAGDRPVLLGTDPPGRLRPASATDGGIDGGADAGPDELRRELQQLRTRLDVLEQERLRVTQQTAEQLQQLSAEVQQIRQQLADAQARREGEDQQREAQRLGVQVGTQAIAAAQQRLAGGDYGVEADLDRAETSLTGRARQDIQAARDALRNRDLVRARQLHSGGVLDARGGILDNSCRHELRH